MIAEVGFIEKVSGSRMATPFGPPRPGSTPTTIPSRMPMNISAILCQLRTWPKPVMSALSSSMFFPQKPSQFSIGPLGSGTLNWISKTKKNTSIMMMETLAAFHQGNLPRKSMKAAMKMTDAT